MNHDLVEAAPLLPENLFYNTTAPGIIIVINRRKRHPGEILLINASKLFAKGRPKNYLADEHIGRIAKIYHEWKAEENISAIITREEVAKNDFNLSPSRYVATDSQEEERKAALEVVFKTLLHHLMTGKVRVGHHEGANDVDLGRREGD